VSLDPKALSRTSFGRHADEYVLSDSHAGGDDLERLVALAAPAPHWTALDVATGGGHTAIALAPHVARMVALDLTPEMLAAAQEHARGQGASGIEFLLGDAESLPFEDDTFDLVACRIAAHHFADVSAFLAEASRVLVPGGLLLLQDQCVPSHNASGAFINIFERMRDPSHACTYSEDGWRTLICRAGLSIEAVEHFEKRQTLERWAAMQSCPAETVTQLHELIDDATESVRSWMRPEGAGAERTFVIHHVLIAARAAS
jgi:ubiquinone/menaquinone biosynthesis C-methylase UbiE